MDKSYKKQKSHKSNNYRKYMNPLLTYLEEYQKAMYLIPNEIDKNNNIKEFEVKIFGIYESIKNVTNEYCEKLKQISKELNPNDKEYEGKIQKVIYDILSNSVEELEKAIKSFNDNKNKIFKMFDENCVQIENFSKEFDNKLESFDSNKKDYLEEMKKYEAYLINEELGLIDNIENDNDKKDKKKKEKNKDKNKILNDNHERAHDKQELYIESKNELKTYLKNIIININSERILVYQALTHNCKIFHQVINEAIKNLHKSFKNGEVFINNEINKYNEIVDEEFLINNIIKDELYSFKFLSFDKNKLNKFNNEGDSNKKKKKDKKDKNEKLNIDNLLLELNDDNIISLLYKIKTNNIRLNKDNTDKIGLFGDKKAIESIIDLILNAPEKYDDDNKNKMISFLTSNEENHYSFMRYLNNFRTNGLFELKKLTITILCDLFTIIVEKALKDNNYKMIQYAFILSLTYCHIDENSNKDNKNNENNKNKNKIYLSRYLRNKKPFHEIKFWTNYFYSLVIDEEEKIAQRNNNQSDEKKKSVFIYTTSFTLIKNMIDYDLNFDFIKEILQEIFNKYKLKDTERSELVNYLIAEIQQNATKNK